MKLKTSKKGTDILSSILLILLGAFIFFYAIRYHEVMLTNDLTDAFLPQVCGGAIAVLALVRLIKCLLNKDEKYCASHEVERGEITDLLRGLGSIALLGAYVFTYRNLGFLVSTALYLFIQLTLLTQKGKRHWLLTVIISIVLPALLYLLFVKVLNYTLPTGILG